MAKRKKKHVVTLETRVTLEAGKGEHNLELDKKRAAIKAALHAATAGLAATTSGILAQAVSLEPADGGTPPVPWGEVIIGPIWEERNPERAETLRQSGELGFWVD